METRRRGDAAARRRRDATLRHSAPAHRADTVGVCPANAPGRTALFAASPRRRVAASLLALALLLFAPVATFAQAERLVVLKVDGLSYAMIERFAQERDPRTGRTALPWIQHVFFERGTRVPNFYTRGMSLSGPSWSLLDTGQHLQIKGNVEYDRFTLKAYDYLNFIPFYINHARWLRADMPGPEVLDEVGLPLLLDAYPYDARHASFQLHQRGARWSTLQRGLLNRITSRTPRELFDEWLMGFETRNILYEQNERELIQKLNDPRIRYLDYYTTDFDHHAHHNRDRETHLHSLQEIDAVVGRIWTAIERSPLAAETALVMVSDHGINTNERAYSQGYNLVRLLGSAEGGGHHVITKRRLLLEYALRGVYPLVPLITTDATESFYLRGQSDEYPTALLDFDGNERAALHLRNNDLNTLHILLQQLQRRDLRAETRRAATDAFFATIDRRRALWTQTMTELNEELVALRRLIERQRAVVAAIPPERTQEERDQGHHIEAMRQRGRLESWTKEERDYTNYTQMLARLLGLRRESFDPARLRLEDLLPPRSMGEANTIYDLQNYVVGLAPGGLTLNPDGSLDLERSFSRRNYFALLQDVTVRNNVQRSVGNRPVDFVATRIPAEALNGALGGDLQADEVIWLYGGRDRQALILGRGEAAHRLRLRYLPISGLTQDATGRMSFQRAAWGAGFPLRIWEDANLAAPAEASARAQFLDQWRGDTEWLRALHRTQYSNGLVGLHEQFARHISEALDVDAPNISPDERLLRRFRQRQRHLTEADFMIHASNHWNFDVRGFNPGGNHGSFYRVSTLSTLMLAGGARTGVPRGLVIEEPYDSLSFVPTMLALTGALPADGRPTPVLWERGFRPFPGRVIRELFARPPVMAPPVAGAESEN